MGEALRAPNQDESLATARRRQIFLAACRVLARKSFHEASVKELALEAGLAAGSIYVYLRSKDDILVLIAESMVAEFGEQLPAIRERAGDDPRRELLEMMRAILDVIDRYKEAFGVLHHEGRYLARRPQYREAMSRIQKDYFGVITEVLERGRRMGAMRFEDSRSVVEAIHMMCSGWATGGHALKGLSKETYLRDITSIIDGRLIAHLHDGSNSGTRR